MTREIRCKTINGKKTGGKSSIQSGQVKWLSGTVWDTIHGEMSIRSLPYLERLDIDFFHASDNFSVFLNGASLTDTSDYDVKFHRIAGDLSVFSNSFSDIHIGGASRSFYTGPDRDSVYVSGNAYLSDNYSLRRIVADDMAEIGDGTANIQFTLNQLNSLAAGDSIQTLTKISFAGLRKVSGHFRVQGGSNGLDSAIYLDFQSLKEVGSFTLSNAFNQDLVFPEIKKISSINISDNKANLTKVEFPDLVRIENPTIFSQLIISNNLGLKSIHFPKLERIQNYFSVEKNPELLNLDSGFPKLEWVGYSLVVKDNAKLSQCCVVACADLHPGLKNITNNTGNCADRATAEAACAPVVTSFSITESLDPHIASDSTICYGDPITLKTVADLGGRIDSTAYFSYFYDLDQDGVYFPL
ncbi:MAG: hypothetical protein R3B47_21475 [Bacteroidia bacterium]